MGPILAVLAGCAIATAASISLGLLLFRLLRIALKGIEHVALAFLSGSAVLSLTVFALGVAGLARPRYYLAVAAIAALAAAAWQGALRFPAGERAPIGWPLRATAAAAFVVFAWIYLFHAAAPELSPDGSYYHLGFVSLYNEHGRIVKVTDNTFAHMPQAVEMLFLFAFGFGRHSAAAMVHLTFLVALAAMVYSYAKRIGKPVAGLFAAFAVFASPIVGWDATRAYIDVAHAAAAFGMFHMLQIWDETGRDRFAIAAGLLAGFACGAKYTGFLALALGAGLMLAAMLGRRAFNLRPIALFLSLALAVFSPWAVRNWLWIGNPVSPLLTAWFPNPYVFPAYTGGRDIYEFLHSEFFPGWSRLPLETTVRGCHVQGVMGPLFLLAPLGLLSCWTAPGRRLCAGAAVMLALYPVVITRGF